jgi:hypothetical protein
MYLPGDPTKSPPGSLYFYFFLGHTPRDIFAKGFFFENFRNTKKTRTKALEILFYKIFSPCLSGFIAPAIYKKISQNV